MAKGGPVDTSRRVALVHDWLNGMRGGEKVFEVLCELFPRATVFTLFYERERVSDPIRRMRVVESPLAKIPGARRHYRSLLPLFPWAVTQFPTSDFDLVISTSHCVAKAARPPRRGLHLCYCFTPMRYIWDQFDDYFPSDNGAGSWSDVALNSHWRTALNSGLLRMKRAAMRALRPRLQRWDRQTADRVDVFYADSRNIARKIRRYYGRRATVLYPPADTDFFTPGDTPPGDDAPYLVVSALVPYKRIDRAIRAANQLERPLIVVGDGPERRRLQSLAGRAVTFRGWIDDEALREAYRGCRALLYPGEEDFGITAVEAQACGRPVIALARGGALETVVDGKTGLFFGDPTPEALAEAMRAFEQTAFQPLACRRQSERFARKRFSATLRKETEEAIQKSL